MLIGAILGYCSFFIIPDMPLHYPYYLAFVGAFMGAVVYKLIFRRKTNG